MILLMSSDGGSSAILLIDDERTFADTLAKRLLLRGYECAVAYDGRSGIALVKKVPFVGLVLDLRLPDLSGTEVLRRIRALDPNLPVVILTAHGTAQDEQDCMRLGAVAFLHKPVNLTQLVSYFAQEGLVTQ